MATLELYVIPNSINCLAAHYPAENRWEKFLAIADGWKHRSPWDCPMMQRHILRARDQYGSIHRAHLLEIAGSARWFGIPDGLLSSRYDRAHRDAVAG